ASFNDALRTRALRTGSERSCGIPERGGTKDQTPGEAVCMDRKTLDSLYAGARGSPKRIFARAASEDPLEATTYDFLLEHVGELDIDVLVDLFRAKLADDVQPHEKPFVRRLAELVPTAGPSQLLEVLRLSTHIDERAWIEELTIPLRGRLPDYQWYRFVDKSRGGEIFSALNVGIPRPPGESIWDPDESFVRSVEEARPEPAVVELLERAYDDLAAAKFALRTRPIIDLIHLHVRFPKLLPLEAVKSAVSSRVASTTESWVPRQGTSELPGWITPFVIERLRHCNDGEAQVLYEWLFAQAGRSHEGDAYELALARFERAPFERFWHHQIGRHLGTGSSWKTRGRKLIESCVDLGRGFPTEAVRAALAAAGAGDGASPEEHRRSIIRKIHDEAARVLVERADAALDAGDYEKGDLFLSALMSLEPGAFIGGAIHRLKRFGDLPGGVIARIEACEKLNRAGGRAPSEDAFFEAFLVLTGQVS
ncbi:MAG: hypothetical protein KF819_38755, partial [Labilithrix sp.]|nr:hypothetical protein [Labilithrix sp.]